MRLKKKTATRAKMLKLIKNGDGRIGVKDVKEIQRLSSEDKLLEAFFSIIIRLQYQLQANFHNKFHVDWKKIHKKNPQKRDFKRLWEIFSEKVDRFATIIFISYSTDLIGKHIYTDLNNLKGLRNQIAHNLTYYEPEIFVTKKEVKKGIEKGINLLSKLEKIQLKITFNKK
ncbi:MAG: hypothetical protein KAT43_01285 [Nanoarchaeota archaeon]|nr:hypothetical protein [Nanoarchaeota archaeon]